MPCMNLKTKNKMIGRTDLKNIFIGFMIGILISGIFLLGWNGFGQDSKSRFIVSTPSHIVTFQKTDNNIPLSAEDKGKININTATLSELDELPGIGEVKAASIIEFREKYGYFEDPSELLYVPGIGKSLFESIQDQISLGNE